MRAPLVLACAAALGLATAAEAQSAAAVDRARGLPAGLALPLTLAGAEEPDAVTVNPGGLGFVDGPALQYFFEGGRGDFSGHGLYLAAPLGPLVPALSLEWANPPASPRHRKTGLALALGFGQVFSAGYAWNWYSSPDPAWDRLFSMDAGATLRPTRFLSLAASAMGLEARLGGSRVPTRYGFGAALRWRDGLVQLAGDLHADDGGRGAFIARSAAATLSVSLLPGLTLQAQYLAPVRRAQGPLASSVFQLAVGVEQPHLGATLAANAVDRAGSRDSTGLVGVRLSSSRYGHSFFRRVQVIDLARALEPPSALARLLGAEVDRYGALLERLAAVAEDPSVAALVVKIDELPLREARIEELRAALSAVRARKPVHAWLVGGGTREYWLATAAGEIYAPPASSVRVNGLAWTAPFLKEGLGKLGIAFEAVTVGRYKSAPEALTRSGPSEAARESAASLLDDRFGRIVEGVAAARRLSGARVHELVDQGVFTAEEATRAGLLDASLWADEVEGRVKAAAGGAPLSSRLDPTPRRAAERWGPRPAVAVIRIEGPIARGRTRLEPFGLSRLVGAETVTRALRRAGDDGSVRAIVLRIESPGGDGQASAEVWRAVVELRRRGKVVVASLGDVAASGGYLVAAGADAIVAEPSTLTGSIGVFALKPDLSGLLAAVGVSLASEQRGQKARIDSPARPWTPEERRLLERQLEGFYRQFVGIVAEARKLPHQEVEAAAQGRVWTGAQAFQRKLVDRLGSLSDAVALAELRAGLTPSDGAEVRRLEPRGGFPDDLFTGLESLAAGERRLEALAARLPELRAAAVLAELGPVLALPVDWLGEGAGR